MRTQRHRGSRVLYIAGGVGEFQEDVQDWLSRPENPAIASGNLYDALALLAKGLCPAALIVSMQSVDWSEMEFFDHVAQICRETTVFVSGPAHQRAKLEAACHRGASLFDGDAASEAVLADRYASGEASTAGIMAGSLRASAREYAFADRRIPSGSGVPSEESRRSKAENGIDDTAKRESPRSDRPSAGVRLVANDEAASEESAGPQRLDDHRAPGEVDRHEEFPVPWLPSSQRPRRVPPTAREASASEDRRPPENAGHPLRPSAVELTQEELAALLGRPAPSGNAAEERGS